MHARSLMASMASSSSASAESIQAPERGSVRCGRQDERGESERDGFQSTGARRSGVVAGDIRVDVYVLTTAPLVFGY